ncbi:MAG: M13 family metallopeptidase [Burkholderiales bacterium]|nr:M13 family metallopeptidase [Burkholderiales bacterium]
MLTTLVCLALAQVGTLVHADEAPAETPLTTFPYTPSLDTAAMDRTADPCVDFYQYACGGWMKNNPIPADQSSWDVYGKLYQDNQRFLWGILDGLAKNTDGRSATQQKIGDYFAACTNEPAVDKLGIAPMQPYLDQIDALKSKNDLPALLAQLHLNGVGAYFGFGSNQDFADSSQVIAFVGAGGLGLPDRDYYFKQDAKSKALRMKYVQHVARMLELSGETPAAARAGALHVMALETSLAGATLTRVELRDPYKLFHKMDAKALQALTPDFDFGAYFKQTGVGEPGIVNVSEPGFMKELAKRFKRDSLADIKTYLRWHVVHASANLLSKNLADANFDFYGKTLQGVPQQQPRWKKCVQMVDSQLGEALGQEFVARAFSPKLKDDTLHMTQLIEQSMEKDIKDLTWMSEETKARALEKLHGLANKIGYPDKWRDYSSVDIKRDDFFGNAQRANAFEIKRQLAKIGKPVDHGEWEMTPPTVNAYYSAQMNDINFPAGILQPPLYDAKMDAAPNYGDTGSTIGHELTHAFDDEGRQYDAKGNLRDWWTKKDAAAFKERAQCVVDQYAKYTAVDELKVNSKLTQGEDIADLGGIILAWMAWKSDTAGQQLEARDGLSPEQRFFVGYAQWSCSNVRPETARLRALTDPHSPAKYRVNGLVVNMPEFEQAFSCKKGQPMVSENRCRVW